MAKRNKASQKRPSTIGGFSRRWENLGKFMGLSKDLSESGGEGFNAKYREFLGLLKSISPKEESVYTVPKGQELSFAQQSAADYKDYVLDYSLRNIKDIAIGLKDKLKDFAYSVVPLNKDEEKRADNLESLIKEQEGIAKSLESNIKNINKDERPEAYETQEKAIAQFKEKASVLKDYKPLVKNIIVYRELVANTGALDGQPRNSELKDLSSRFLKGILNSFKGDRDKYKDNAPIVMTIRRCLNNPDFLMAYYAENILQPAKYKLEKVAENFDLGDYAGKSIKVVDQERQVEYLNRIYSINRESQRKRNLNRMYEEELGIPKFGFREAA